MSHATLNMNGKTFVLVPERKYRTMTAAKTTTAISRRRTRKETFLPSKRDGCLSPGK